MGYFKEIYASELPHRAIAVYMYLHDRADKEGKCWPAIPTIARELRMSRSTVKRALTDLIEEGYLKKEFRYRENGGHTSNLYTLF
ncbi:helix-turn-helix domain-containing protein [Sporofaciens musculi]|uniref:helix-turn-helix domain-containing protein n=1 Tax=Sporofaciens musculi TaxID=2681861 RepID=UPI00256FD400|nr:helix-turn-helix domain-containing protein [Sporofaciens musculi]